MTYLHTIHQDHEQTQRLNDLPPAVAIYGSARLPLQHPACQLAQRLARRLSDEGCAIITGGGGGIMESANQGAFTGRGVSVGLNIKLPREQQANPHQHLALTYQNFSLRKDAFTLHARAFVVMEGGMGTLDELFHTLTQMQTKKMAKSPVILVGSMFWEGLIEWIRQQLAQTGLISLQDLDLIQMLDDENQIVKTVLDHLKSPYF